MVAQGILHGMIKNDVNLPFPGRTDRFSKALQGCDVGLLNISGDSLMCRRNFCRGAVSLRSISARPAKGVPAWLHQVVPHSPPTSF